jgi:hypothetical protein
MFSPKELAKRVKGHRRSNGGSQLPIETPQWDFEQMLDCLCRWAFSMPWVVETPESGREPNPIFVIDCSELSCHRLWFCIEAANEEWGADQGLYAVLPDALAQRAVASGWAYGLEKVCDARSMTYLELPTCAAELSALQRVLEAGYACAFDSSR